MEIGSDIVLCETSNKVARLTLNRPAARNSLSLAMLEQLHKTLHALGTDNSIHVIIIAGNGPAFCAGHDLKEMTAARSRPDKGKEFFPANNVGLFAPDAIDCDLPQACDCAGSWHSHRRRVSACGKLRSGRRGK